MKHPKKADMAKFMGCKCRFIDGELHRTYLKKKVDGISPNKVHFLDDRHGYAERVPVRWKSSKYTPKVLFTVGWIVGFGFCYNGTIHKDSVQDGGHKYFQADKMIHYVRIRLTPTGKEIKVLAKNITEVCF